MLFDPNKAYTYFPNTNFMTPNILRVGFRGRYAYELSEGEGFDRRPIFGVSLRLKSTADHVDGKLFQKKTEAENFISELEGY